MVGIGQAFFTNQVNGNIITIDGVNYGSENLAQQFSSTIYLWGRYMKLDESTFINADERLYFFAYPSNISVESDEFIELMKKRAAFIKEAHNSEEEVPIDLITISGSGMDPDISVAAAYYQINRLVDAWGGQYVYDDVKTIIDNNTTEKFLWIFGEETVNVLAVNLTLAGLLS
jgi:potassium-transporting ATPase KdpC subunit